MSFSNQGYPQEACAYVLGFLQKTPHIPKLTLTTYL